MRLAILVAAGSAVLAVGDDLAVGNLMDRVAVVDLVAQVGAGGGRGMDRRLRWLRGQCSLRANCR